ncbi:hypothetical protein PIB30_000534 [Stylosanthes scabra]|uniref:Uncharacterized protein n=1 Tax=Stylosanthes scabra TaxID=79078 RepID=A0ABU6W0J2_9FABA|nr:hypothetical protein [Stylosanthes scabra]
MPPPSSSLPTHTICADTVPLASSPHHFSTHLIFRVVPHTATFTGLVVFSFTVPVPSPISSSHIVVHSTPVRSPSSPPPLLHHFIFSSPFLHAATSTAAPIVFSPSLWLLISSLFSLSNLMFYLVHSFLR